MELSNVFLLTKVKQQITNSYLKIRKYIQKIEVNLEQLSIG